MILYVEAMKDSRKRRALHSAADQERKRKNDERTLRELFQCRLLSLAEDHFAANTVLLL